MTPYIFLLQFLFKLGLWVPVSEVRGRVSLGSGCDGDDHIQTALSILDWSPEVVTDLPGQLPQVNLHPAHPVILATNIMIKHRNVNEVIQLLIPVQVKGLSPLGVERIVQCLGLGLLLAQCYLAVRVGAGATIHGHHSPGLHQQHMNQTSHLQILASILLRSQNLRKLF